MSAQLMIKNTTLTLTAEAAKLIGITENRCLVKIEDFRDYVTVKVVHKHEPSSLLFVRKVNGDYMARSINLSEYVMAFFELEPNHVHVFDLVSMFGHKVVVLKLSTDTFGDAEDVLVGESTMPDNCKPFTAEGNFNFRQFNKGGRWKYGIE